MTERKKRLELTWIGKEERPRLEPRILLEDPSLSYHATKRVTDHDIFDNRLIHGDNLLALKALEQEFAGKVKCVFIDPPYNTGSAFTHYDDGIEHSVWLSLMRDRVELLRSLLREDGTLWVTLDDTEVHYFKVMADEVFGRANFVANVVWQKRFSPNSTAQWISDSHDHVLVYAKEKQRWVRNLLPRDEKHNEAYKNPDADPRGVWTSGDLSARNSYSAGIYPITTPAGRVIPGPPKGMYWRVSKEKFAELDADARIWWGKSGDNTPRLKRFLTEVMEGIVPQTIWPHDEVGHTQEAKKEVMAAVPPDAVVFQTPKPERLIQRILNVATKPGDLVLDSFAGSGTTGAVAHKMRRRWIMIEIGDHCFSHVIPRLHKVVDGDDDGGISQSTDWAGGGGFRFIRLGPSLLQRDRWGNWVVSKDYKPEMLAEAMCKLEGFRYAPDSEKFWLHGKSTENDFIYVTTQNLSREQLQFISDQVGGERTLLICCAAFRAKNEFPNLTVKKIPQAVLSRCEWGRDDYSLNVQELPPVQAVEESKVEAASFGGATKAKPGRRKKGPAMQELPLFGKRESKEEKPK